MGRIGFDTSWLFGYKTGLKELSGKQRVAMDDFRSTVRRIVDEQKRRKREEADFTLSFLDAICAQATAAMMRPPNAWIR